MRMDEYMHVDNNPVKEFTIVQDVTSEAELCHVIFHIRGVPLPSARVVAAAPHAFLSPQPGDSIRQYLQFQGHCLL